MKLAVLILNWNRTKETLACVRAVSGWTSLRPVIWVVDNASRESCGPALAREFPAVRFFQSLENLGFAGGNNRGLEKILEGDAETVLLLNNDASLSEDSARRMVETLAQRPDLFAVGPLIEEHHGGWVRTAVGGLDISRHLRTRRYVAGSAEGLVACDYVPGAVVLLRGDRLREIGLFDERYFFSGEMADLCERARQHGDACGIAASAKAVHWSDDGSPLRESLHLYYSLRNRFLFVETWRRTRRLRLRLFWALCGLALAAQALARGNRARARAASLAVHDGLRGRFGNCNKLFLR